MPLPLPPPLAPSHAGQMVGGERRQAFLRGGSPPARTTPPVHLQTSWTGGGKWLGGGVKGRGLRRHFKVGSAPPWLQAWLSHYAPSHLVAKTGKTP